LQQDVVTVYNQPFHANYRIAVFGPFNYGKSTLLNALLGERALPIDLIPTTGAAITVRYGDSLQTRIALTNGSEICEAGTEVLKRYAVLDDNRRMRTDVAAVEVFCPHPFLKMGVELVDLPGTDDREAQDALVKDQLLTADLVVQLLDARKLMTLGEREQMRDWLLDRGIDTVIFVVNFLNLMAPDEQKQVQNRLRFVAESFRAKLPPGVSNLYCVDALPALRARLKGDAAAAQVAGLPAFESALQTIVQAQTGQTQPKLARVQRVANQVRQALQAKVDHISNELAAIAGKRDQKAQIKRQAAELIRQGFANSSREFMEWLAMTNLLNRYQHEAAIALRQGTFRTWMNGSFKSTAIDHQQSVAKWVQQACEFFDRPRPHQLLVAFPPEPQVMLPDLSAPSQNSAKLGDVPPVAIATGLGWVLGGPVGGAILGGASYLLNKTLDSDQPDLQPSLSIEQLNYLCVDAAREFLVNFSSLNLAALKRYASVAEQTIQFTAASERTETRQYHQLRLLQDTLNRLETALRSI
jgi:GTP-binding protein EngB required for normal cell division